METLVIDNIFSHLVVPNVLKNIYEHILARHLSNVIFVWRVLRRNIIYFDTEIFILWRRNILVKYVSNILLIRHNIKDIKQPILQNTIRLQKVRIFLKSSTSQKDIKSSNYNFISSWDAWDCRPSINIDYFRSESQEFWVWTWPSLARYTRLDKIKNCSMFVRSLPPPKHWTVPQLIKLKWVFQCASTISRDSFIHAKFARTVTVLRFVEKNGVNLPCGCISVQNKKTICVVGF